MKRLALLAVGALLLIQLLAPVGANADVNFFTINSFTADETLTNSDKQGQLAITETIDLTFTDDNHGILRSLPKTYKNQSLDLHISSVTSPSGAPSSYSTYDSNGNTVLKIGSANRTVTGHQQYVINYTMGNVITFYPDHDELYWDINGDQWQQPFTKVSVVLHTPQDLQHFNKPLCYTGSYGENGTACTITGGGTTDLTAETTAGLTAGQTLTIVDGYQKGYFTASTWRDNIGAYVIKALKVLLLPLLTFIAAYILWRRKGRDAKGTGVIIPQYGPPDNLSPLQVGTLIDYSTDNKDITATIIDLAVRRYIKIIESKEDKFLRKDTLNYSLEVTNANTESLTIHEKTILNALFDQQIVLGRTVNITTLQTNFASTAETIKKELGDQLTTLGYFRSNPQSAGAGLLIVAIGLGALVFFAGGAIGIYFGIGVVLSALIAYLFSKLMPALTPAGVVAKEHIQGLRMYLNVAEKDRTAKLQAPNAAYATQSGEPVKTVELFEKLLPYAIILGVENEWAKQFESLYTTQPDWYSGNWTSFNAVYLASSLSDGIGTTINTAFTAPRSSGSSGFSGGFSGGGGGGGGGGGW